MTLFLTILILAAGAATLGWFVIYASLLTEMFHHAGMHRSDRPADPVVAQTLRAAKYAFPVAMTALIISVVAQLRF